MFSSAQPFRFLAGTQGRSLPGAEIDPNLDNTTADDQSAAAADPSTKRFLQILEAILATAEQEELPLARNMIEQVIARRIF